MQTYGLCGMRFYKTGFVMFAGPFCIRWNRQQNYTELAFERLKSNYRHYGGMTWTQFRQHRRDLKSSVEAEA